jgi:predicted dehydrogenase
VNAPIRVALIGYGYWGPNYARVLDEIPEVVLQIVCDARPDRLDHVRRRYRDVDLITNADDVLSRTDIDAVVIATPASTHQRLVAQALTRGLHVLVEKPMALEIGHCEDLCRLAESSNSVLLVGYTFLYNAGIQKMKECMAPSVFGQTYYLHATRTNLGPIREDVNAVWDLAPHDVAIFNYLLDEQPQWVSAFGTRVLKNVREDIGFVTLGYQNGVLGNIHVSWVDPNKVREVVAVGSHRRVVFNDLNDVERVRCFERGVSTPPDLIADTYGEFKLLLREGDIISPKISPSEPLKNQCMDFINAIRTGRRPIVDCEFAAGVVRTLVAIEASMRDRGKAVSL